MIIQYFNRAGATGHVFFFRGGKPVDKGLAYSGFVLPATTVAVVPTVPQILNFDVEVHTKDKQEITVAGDIKVKINPANKAVMNFDFTVNPSTGSYLTAWQQTLNAVVIERVLPPIREIAKNLTVEDAILSHEQFAQAIQKALSADTILGTKGITVESCSVATVLAADEQVGQAIGAKEKQVMLSAADQAVHERRMAAATSERTLQTYESETKLTLEKERTKLVEEQGANEVKRAGKDAEASKIRLEALAEVDPAKVLGAAIMKMAEGGRIGSINIGPELLEAIRPK
jgi:regulator of protease activity HflC (stomatin/prohibitin superfamily)